MMTQDTPTDREPEEMAREMLSSFFTRTFTELTDNGAPADFAMDAMFFVGFEKRLQRDGAFETAKTLLLIASGIIAARTGTVPSHHDRSH